MVLARMTKWTFKSGKRQEAFSELDSTLGNVARANPGFRGVLSLLSRDDPNVGVVITLWNDEESLRSSESNVLPPSVQKVTELLTERPTVQNFRLFTAELRAITPSE